jgi:hypothetical protein
MAGSQNGVSESPTFIFLQHSTGDTSVQFVRHQTIPGLLCEFVIAAISDKQLVPQ